MLLNPERVHLGMNPFRVKIFSLISFPGLSLRSNPGLKLANAFGVLQTEPLPEVSGTTIQRNIL
jgi:hypothetical protein